MLLGNVTAACVTGGRGLGTNGGRLFGGESVAGVRNGSRVMHLAAIPVVSSCSTLK
jgi:hypothetical protein